MDAAMKAAIASRPKHPADQDLQYKTLILCKHLGTFCPSDKMNEAAFSAAAQQLETAGADVALLCAACKALTSLACAGGGVREETAVRIAEAVCPRLQNAMRNGVDNPYLQAAACQLIGTLAAVSPTCTALLTEKGTVELVVAALRRHAPFCRTSARWWRVENVGWWALIMVTADDPNDAGARRAINAGVLALPAASGTEDAEEAVEEQKTVLQRLCAVAARRCAECGMETSELRRCSACGVLSYCGKECQRASWTDGHKGQCARIKLRKAETQQ
jgi:hypothetical protein